mmetsp:Transcript_9/g.21  ORF Transcript_9/g.21 Transcript_9/m.21 type:complete len:336 (+) Transcript_9:1004-2011(+)
MAELALQVLVLFRDPAVILRKLLVPFLVPGIELLVLLHHAGEVVLDLCQLLLLLLQGGGVLVVALGEDSVVVLELLRVELVRRAHLLELLLEGLNVGLQLDLQLVVLLGVLDEQVVDLPLVLLLPLLLHGHVRQLHRPPLLEQAVDLVLVVIQKLVALLEEGALDRLELRLVLFLKILELGSHALEHLLHIVGLLLEGLHVLLVLALELLLKLLDQLVLRVDDVAAALLLAQDLAVELLGHVLVEELGPAHFNSGVLLSRANGFFLEALKAVLSELLLMNSPLILPEVSLDPDVGDTGYSSALVLVKVAETGAYLPLALAFKHGGCVRPSLRLII